MAILISELEDEFSELDSEFIAPWKSSVNSESIRKAREEVKQSLLRHLRLDMVEMSRHSHPYTWELLYG